MRLARIAKTAGLAGWAVLLAAGCATTSGGGPAGTATTPQDKAHQDQLSEMGREDGETATTSAKKADIRKPPTTQRRSGQGVVDQPVRK